MDLGADQWQTFRHVTFPAIRTALLAGGAAGVRAVVRRGHRDDVHDGRRRADDPHLDPPELHPDQGLPIVNAVALILIVVSIIPVYIAQRLVGSEGVGVVRARQQPGA